MEARSACQGECGISVLTKGLTLVNDNKLCDLCRKIFLAPKDGNALIEDVRASCYSRQLSADSP